jgi:hypothetical protein
MLALTGLEVLVVVGQGAFQCDLFEQVVHERHDYRVCFGLDLLVTPRQQQSYTVLGTSRHPCPYKTLTAFIVQVRNELEGIESVKGSSNAKRMRHFRDRGRRGESVFSSA